MNEQQPNPNKKWGKEEIMAALKECAAKLGHVPSFPEFKAATGLPRQIINRHFANYSKALRACGLEREGSGYKVPMEKLFADYVAVVRALGQVPTMAEYELRSSYTRRPLLTRFAVWSNIPLAMLQYAEPKGMEGEWGDVLNVLRTHCESDPPRNRIYRRTLCSTGQPRILEDRPVYGASLRREPLAHAPVNENGVLFLFGALASKLGFSLLWIGTEFPDCEALREVTPGRWQRVRIELEFESRNFLRHMHSVTDCDLIVCWEHNWAECPVEVLELKSEWAKQNSTAD